MSLTMENITLTYPDGESRVTALDNVSLNIPNGSFTAVVGPSGSGKSSALAVAATLITPDSGKLVIADRNIQDMNEKQRAQLRRENIGIVFQQANLLSSLSALEQLQLQASLVGTSMKESETKALDFLDTVGLADHRNKKPSQLSGGQQQRVNIARALMNDPDLILADEPTSALDQQKSLEVMTLIREITKSRNTATMFITHDPSALIQPDQTITIVDGKIVSAHTAEVAPSL